LKRYLLLLLGLLITTFFSMANMRSEQDGSYNHDSLNIKNYDYNHISLTDSVVNYGKLFLNTPYHYGSPGISSFDCSGFTSYVYRNFGYSLGRSSSDQAMQFDPIERNLLKPGDLVFFSGSRRSKRVGHVGIVVSTKDNGEFDFIHSAVHSGVTISNSTEAYYTRRFIKASRVIGTNQMLAISKFISKSEKPADDTVISAVVTIQTKKTKKIIPAEYHRVKSGETLSSIAHKFGLSITELRHFNKIKGSKLTIKQNLKVKKEQSILVEEPIQLATSNIQETNKINNTKSQLPIIQEASVTSIIASHIVKKGETLFSISKLYNTTVDELKKINNILSGKIHPGQELKLNQLIVSKESDKSTFGVQNKTEDAPKAQNHKVAAGETLFGISKIYNIPVEDLKKFNNLTKGNIQPGQNIKLSETTAIVSKVKEVEKGESSVKSKIHKVQEGESLILIAKKYDISVSEIKKMNNLASSKIHAGQKLKLTNEENLQVNNSNSSTENPSKIIRHKVKSGESYYSIAKIYGCTIDELKNWNNKTGSKIKVGEKVNVFAKAGK
jgi:LysM repeat protein